MTLFNDELSQVRNGLARSTDEKAPERTAMDPEYRYQVGNRVELCNVTVVDLKGIVSGRELRQGEPWYEVLWDHGQETWINEDGLEIVDVPEGGVSRPTLTNSAAFWDKCNQLRRVLRKKDQILLDVLLAEAQAVAPTLQFALGADAERGFYLVMLLHLLRRVRQLELQMNVNKC